MKKALIVGILVLGLVTGKQVLSAPATTTVPVSEPVDVAATTDVSPVTAAKIYLGNWRVTCYCSCAQCCGEYALNRPVDENGQEIVYGAYGTQLRAGVSCASSATFPQGTRLYLEGYGEVVVEDTTADWIQDKYDGHIVDIYVNTHEDAYALSGYREVWLVNDRI